MRKTMKLFLPETCKIKKSKLQNFETDRTKKLEKKTNQFTLEFTE